jgi:hypothetical protein
MGIKKLPNEYADIALDTMGSYPLIVSLALAILTRRRVKSEPVYLFEPDDLEYGWNLIMRELSRHEKGGRIDQLLRKIVMRHARQSIDMAHALKFHDIGLVGHIRTGGKKDG